MRKRKPKDLAQFRLTVEALLSDLAHRCLSGGERIHLSLDNNSLKGMPRYRPTAVGMAVVQALDLLSKPDIGPWLIHHPHAPGEQTSIEAGPRLLHYMEERGVSLRHLWSDFADAETIVLKRADEDCDEDDAPASDLPVTEETAPSFPPHVSKWQHKPPQFMKYNDTEETIRMREEMAIINANLRGLNVEMFSGCLREYWSVDMRAVCLRRRFTKGDQSFACGGRLYDATNSAVWYSMSNKKPEHYLAKGIPVFPRRLERLRIEGEEVASADIKSANLAIFYAMSKVELPEGDLYSPPGYGPEHRDTFKLAASCMGFYKSQCRRWPNPDPHKPSPTLRASEAFTVMEEMHAPIRHLFWCQAGHRAQRVESDVLVRTLINYPGLCALPLHDALIVPESKEEEAMEALEASFAHVTGGGRCNVDIERA